MAAWHSLAGYLVCRPSGPLSRLQSRRRWFVFDESRCQLLSFKTEKDAGQKNPVATIDVRGSAIRLSTTESNQFIIHSNDKDYILVAENHESMMIWLMALQAKRDDFNNSFSAFVEKGCLNKCEEAEKRKESLPSDQEMQTIIRQTIRAENPFSIPVPFHASHPRPFSMIVLEGSESSSGDGMDGQQQIQSPGIRRSTMPCCAKKSLLHRQSTLDDGPRSCPLPSVIHERGPRGGVRGGSLEEDRTCESETIADLPEAESYWKRLSRKSSSNSIILASSDANNGNRCRGLENELIATKCELAKVLNRESSLKSALGEREELIGTLEERAYHSDSAANDINPSRLREKCRILQNQNRFLNEEVLKLSRMWQQEQRHVLQKNQQIEELEGTIEHLKRDYVLLLQSSIRIPACEGPEVIEVQLFGGNRHRERVSQLIEQARKVNPSLPTFEGLLKAGCHVDSYGFRYTHVNEGLSLHYLSGLLKQHYNAHLLYTDRRQLDWKELLSTHSEELPRTKEVKNLIREGIPAHLRSLVWVALVRQRVKAIAEAKGSHYYRHLVSIAPDSETVAQYRRQIALDLLRTMPNNIHFSDVNADGVKKMQEVLQAFCYHNPNVGYCQGMNFIVGMALLFMEAEDAFWCLVAVTECYFLPHYFDQSLIGAQADQEVLRELLGDKLPRLSEHIASHEIELCTVTLNWFLAIFFDCVPFETLLHIWDCFLSEGPKVLFRFTLALLKLRESTIMNQTDAVAIMKQIKASARLCFDVDGLKRTAFNDLEPFPRRADISTKQICYQKTLKEMYKKQRLDRQTLETKEKMLQDLLITTNDVLGIECATVFDGDKLWICQGHHHFGQVIKVNGGECIMYNLNIEFDSRIMCVHAINNSVVILGTLAHYLYAFNLNSKDQLWKLQLNDVALDLCSSQESSCQCRAFTALADGTVAVLDNIDKTLETSPTCFYVQISTSPIMCLQLINKNIWCASGNKVTILTTQTLDVTDQFFISNNTMDIISQIVENDFGIWISVRGSSVIQAWDQSSLICKMMFDTRDNKYSQGQRDDDNYNPGHVTSLLPYYNSLWVGTADGTLLIFDISNRVINRSIATSDSSSQYERSPGSVEDTKGPESPKHEVDMWLELLDQGNNGSPKPVRDRSDSGYQTVGLDVNSIKEPTEHRQSCEFNGSIIADCCSSSTVKGSSSVELSPRNSCDVGNLSDFVCPSRKDSMEATQSSVIALKKPLCNGCLCNKVNGSTNNDSSIVGIARPTTLVSSKTSGFRLCQCKRIFHKCRSCAENFYQLPLRRLTSSTRMSKRRHTLASPEFGMLQTLSEISLSTSDVGEQHKNNVNMNNNNHCSLTNCAHFGSFDNVSHLLTNSCESMLSSPVCDSYEYDDVFVAYTEDERSLSAEPFATDSVGNGVRYAEELIKLFQVPPKNEHRQSLPKKILRKNNYFNRHVTTPAKASSASDLNHNQLVLGQQSLPFEESVGSDDNNKVTNSESALTGPNRQWSSFDDLSTPSNIEYDSMQDSQQNMDYLKLTPSVALTTAKSSDSGSYISHASSDIPFNLELNMKEKIKIADRAIKVLLAIRCNNEPAIVSCSGSARDDESVLKWTIEGEEKLWTNDPIVEVCPYTNTVKPSCYARSRLPRRSSSIVSSAPSTLTNSSQDSTKQNQGLSSRFMRMQSLLSALTSDR